MDLRLLLLVVNNKREKDLFLVADILFPDPHRDTIHAHSTRFVRLVQYPVGVRVMFPSWNFFRKKYLGPLEPNRPRDLVSVARQTARHTSCKYHSKGTKPQFSVLAISRMKLPVRAESSHLHDSAVRPHIVSAYSR